MLPARAAAISSERRNRRLQILFPRSRGISAHQLQPVTAFRNVSEEENVMDIPSEFSLRALNIRAVNRFPIVTGRMEFLTLTFNVTFRFYLFNKQRSRYVTIIPGCVETLHTSSGLQVFFTAPGILV